MNPQTPFQPKYLPALLALLCTAAFSQKAPTRPAPEVAPAAAVAQQAVANTPYAIGAQRKGVAKCIARINQVTAFLTGNGSTNSGMVFNAVGPDVNQKLVSTVLEVQGGDNNSSFVSASFAPNATAQDCSATYDAVTYWPQSCSVVASSSFAAFKIAQPLYKSVNTLDGGTFVKVFLMPAGTGCVSIKKEVLY
jgi:hypothetical protein